MILLVENLTIRLPITGALRSIVRDLSFSIAPGETLGVVGESGCGKSLTNLALMGLLPERAEISAVRLELCGHDLLTMASSDDWRQVRGRCAAMIFQNPLSSLNPALTIGYQMAEVVIQANPVFSRSEVREAVLELLDQVGISQPAARIDAYPHEFSGGMAQRVMIAMALASQPELLIADEPTTALDVTTQRQIMDLLMRLRDERGMAVIMVSHDIGLVSAYADRIQVMYAGELVESGPASLLVDFPRHPYTRGLVASQPGRTGRPHKSPLAVIPGQVPALDSDITGCCFAGRCPMAQKQCEMPQTLQRPLGTSNWLVRCYR